MKKYIAALLALILMLALIPAAALAYDESFTTYVYCTDSACPGYCYVYDQPSSVSGRNLGRINNGTWITVYSTENGWCYISSYTTDGKFVYGYVHE